MLRAALLNMDNKGELQRIANTTEIAGGVETLRKMIADPLEIAFIDIEIIGVHFGISA